MSMHEAGTTAKEWTGIQVEGWGEGGTGWEFPGSHAGGVGGCGVIGTRINNCKRGLYLKQTNPAGWITSCWFEKIYVAGVKWAGVDQDLMGTAVTNENEFASNMFRDIVIQSSSGIPAFGFRNMGHRRCIYDNCLVWDTIAGQIKGHIDPFTRSNGSIVAEDNEIRGGVVAHDFAQPSSGTFSGSHALVLAGYYTAGAPYPKYFQDNGDNTQIIGDWQVGAQLGKIYIPPTGGLGGTATLSIEGRKTDSNTLVEIVAASDAVQTIMSWWNNSKSERMSFTRSTTMIFESIKQTSGGTLRPMIFRMNDVPGVGATEAFRILTTGNVQMGDGRDIALGTTTGTKIGTTTTQKLGFYNKTPIIQPSAITTPTADVTSLKTAVDAIRDGLDSIGVDSIDCLLENSKTLSACHGAMMKKGLSSAAADRYCGKLQQQIEGASSSSSPKSQYASNASMSFPPQQKQEEKPKEESAQITLSQAARRNHTISTC